MINRYIKILEYCDKNFIYFYVPILPWFIDVLFINKLFTLDDNWLPTSIIGKIYVLGYVYPYIFFIIYPNLIRVIIMNLNNITKKLFYSRLTVLQFIAAILLIIALFDIEAMGYFTFLRIYIFSVGILSMYQFYKASEKADNEDQKNLLGGSAIFSFIFAVLFNPIFPVYFWDKTPWYWIDSIAALYFLLWVFVNDYRIPKN